jgi:hypothetical protein
MKGLIKLFTLSCLIFSSGLLFAQSEEPSISQSEDIYKIIFSGVSGFSGEISLDELSEVTGLELFTTNNHSNLEFLNCKIILSQKGSQAVLYSISDVIFDLGFLTRLSLLEPGDRIIIEGGTYFNSENGQEIRVQPTVYEVI